jgi:hypothetical protein
MIKMGLFSTLPRKCGSLRGQPEVHRVTESFEARPASFHSRLWRDAMMNCQDERL